MILLKVYKSFLEAFIGNNILCFLESQIINTLCASIASVATSSQSASLESIILVSSYLSKKTDSPTLAAVCLIEQY